MEQRQIIYDRDLDIEAYALRGVVRKFPNHFHEHYVIGFVEGGRRQMWCRDRAYQVSAGDLVLFNPRDSHCCAPAAGTAMDYRAVNISPAVMARAVGEVSGREAPLRFAQNLLPQSPISDCLRALYLAVLRQAPPLEKEEAFFLLLDRLLCSAAVEGGVAPPPPDPAIQALCRFMEERFAQELTLDLLAGQIHVSKSWLLRAFTKQLGVSPYRYLQTVRLTRAKALLEQGVPVAEAAIQSGFADQSHFTRFFRDFIGLTPGQYQRIFTEPSKGEQEHGL